MTLHCLSWFWVFQVFDIKNRTEPKPVGLTRFRFGFGFFLKKIGLITFFDKNRTEPKMIAPSFDAF